MNLFSHSFILMSISSSTVLFLLYYLVYVASIFFFRVIYISSKCIQIYLLVLFIPFSWNFLRSMEGGRALRNLTYRFPSHPDPSFPSCLFLSPVFLPSVSSKAFKNSINVETLGMVERKHTQSKHKGDIFRKFSL